jgi:hypothetical protein
MQKDTYKLVHPICKFTILGQENVVKSEHINLQKIKQITIEVIINEGNESLGYCDPKAVK